MKLKRVTLALAGLGILTLYGCGGSSSNVTPGSSATTTVPVTVSATTTVPVTVIDGLINKATVCLDINNNGLCDTGEPSKTTDATGKANLVVENALVGKHAVIAVVGINAIDMDRPTTAITVPFTLKAPADQTAVITPLTTMVLTEMENMGVTSAVAAQTIQTETGITVPLFEDFTKGTTQAHKDIATLARLAVVTTQQQSEAVKAAVGTQDISGATITQLQLNKAVSKRLREIVAKLAEAAKNSAVANAVDAAAQETALAKQATTLLGTDGLTTATVATQVAIDNQLAAPVVADTPAAGFSLANLSVTDAANWYVRVMSASQAQNTPDAAGNVKYVERRFLSTGGAVANWGAGSNPARQADLHWNGTTWANCPVNFENTNSVRDAKGNSTYNYCAGRETGSSNRATFDVAGKKMIDVYKQIQAAGYTNLNIGAADQVLATSLLGTAVFPAGSLLQYQTSTMTSAAAVYNPGTNNIVIQSPIGVGAGGTAIASPQPTCATDTGLNDAPAVNLDELISKNVGSPCINPTNANTGARNEAWGGTTLGMGTLGTVKTQPNVATNTLTSANYYTGNTRLRVAFGTGNVAKFYSCQERLNGSTRNCDPLGNGTYAITTLANGDRTMTFGKLPHQFTALNYTQVFIERGGKIYGGYQSKLALNKNVRLKTKAANALLSTLNPSYVAIDPAATIALTAASYQGTWDVRDPNMPTSPGTTLTINANGTANCKWNGTNPIQGAVCTATVSPTGVVDISEAIGTAAPFSTAKLNLDFLAGTGSGTFNDSTATPTTGSVVVTRR